MNKYLFPALALCVLAFQTSCDDVDADNRYIFVGSVVPQRTVLIEDFTGQNCVNCPAAHRTLEQLVGQYPDDVIPVSIHAGSFGIPVTSTRYTGLMQPEGDTYNDAWGIVEWPKGVVNRRGGARNPDDWAQAVRDELDLPSLLGIALEADYEPATGLIDIHATLSPVVDIEGRLQVWITEDNITARQEDVDLGRIEDYVHMHVYRASVNSVGGESITLSAGIHAGRDFTIECRHTDTETWNPDQLSVVAFVYDGSGVVQAAKTKIITQQ